MASKGNILRGHHSEPDAGYEKSLPDAALTVGTISRALSDSKAALAASTKLAEDVDDLDELIASIEKSTAEHRAIIQRIESGRKATADSLAKLRAAIDNSPATLAKAMAWERGFFEKQWAAEVKKGHESVDFETYLAQIEGEREMRKRAERDDYPIEPMSEARFNAQFRVVR